MNDALTPPFATKIAILVRDDLLAWQRLNVTAFLATGIAAANHHLVGEPYADADGTTYLPLLGMPVLVFQADAATLAAARERARSCTRTASPESSGAGRQAGRSSRAWAARARATSARPSRT